MNSCTPLLVVGVAGLVAAPMPMPIPAPPVDVRCRFEGRSEDGVEGVAAADDGLGVGFAASALCMNCVLFFR